MANVPQVIKFPLSGVTKHGGFYASLGLSPAPLPRAPVWIPPLRNCQLVEQG